MSNPVPANPVLERLIAAEEALVTALDGGDVAAIERANADLARATSALRAIGGWRAHPQVKERLVVAVRTAEAGRIRAGYLADGTRRRLQTLMGLAGFTPGAYGRDGRVRAFS